MPQNKIIIASDSFKGCLSSREVGEAAAQGVKCTIPDATVEIIPVADGGEGTMETLGKALNGRMTSALVTDPLGRKITAGYYISGQTAILEMAAASGLTLISAKKRNPLLTTSYGTGELIRDALMKGCRNFLIGIGGSATNDAGVGMLMALGFRFLDAEGNPVGLGGAEVGRIRSIDSSKALPQLKDASFIVACDVCNPLAGADGASRIFGPQKGADAETVRTLDAYLSSFAEVTHKIMGFDFSSRPGAGAAGGMGFAFLSFLGAELKPGVELILDALEFDRKIEDASLVITGEGRLDRQTCLGKTPFGVLNRCKLLDIPVVAIAGAVETAALPSLMKAGFSGVYPVTPAGMPLSEAMIPTVASKNIKKAVAKIIDSYII